jgi:hypothetical protein
MKGSSTVIQSGYFGFEGASNCLAGCGLAGSRG